MTELPSQIRVKTVPPPVEPVVLGRHDRATSLMAASLLLEYPDETCWDRREQIAQATRTLPAPLAEAFAAFLATTGDRGRDRTAQDYVATFDLKRKCCLYLSYYAAGDTRRRGMALVTFLEAYRAAGWEFDADELPDFLPAVLELASLADSEVSSALLSAHRDGLEVLRAALLELDSPWGGILDVVCRVLPPIDDATRRRMLSLVNSGPPAETVGLSFIGNLPPFSPHVGEATT